MNEQIQSFTRSYYATLIGLQVMFVGFLFFGRVPVTSADVTKLTDYGSGLFVPEHELIIYLASIVGTVLFSVCIGQRFPSRVQPPLAASTSVWKCVTATAGAASFLALCTVFPLQSGALDRLSIIGLLVFLGFMALQWSVVLLLNNNTAIQGWLTMKRQTDDRPSESISVQRTPHCLCVADLAVVALLVALVYIPNVAGLASSVFCVDRLHHWDFFAMGPAIGYLHGGSLGSQIYTQYGVGFPLLAALLSRWIPLTYPNVFHIAVMIGCLYYAGLYGFLRGLVRSWKWAFFGVMLAIDLQLFHGVDAHGILWQYPSSTILRSPFDICVFAALLLDTRSVSRIPLFIASLLVGLAVLFETDTGVYLALTLAFYVVLTRWKTSEPDWKRFGSDTLASLLPGTAVAVLGLEIAGRGHALNWTFLIGWLQVFRFYPSGIGMLPITISAFGIVLSFVLISVYLAVTSYQINEWWHSGSNRRGALLAAIAVYGLCYLCQFIGRSHPYNLYHSCIPFVILVVVFVKAGTGLCFDAPALHHIKLIKNHGFPLILAVCVLLHVATLSNFRVYPNVFHLHIEGITESGSGVTLARTGVRVPAAMAHAADNFNMATFDARRLSEGRNSVFFLVNNDPIYYLAAGAKSHFRYFPLFHCLVTRSIQAEFERQFVRERIDYVFDEVGNQAGKDGDAPWDVQQSLRQIVKANYRLDHRCGSFDVWRHL